MSVFEAQYEYQYIQLYKYMAIRNLNNIIFDIFGKLNYSYILCANTNMKIFRLTLFGPYKYKYIHYPILGQI